MRIALVTAAAAAFASAGSGCSTAGSSSPYPESGGFSDSGGYSDSGGSSDTGGYTEPASPVEEETVYCVDEQRVVVDDDFCDEAHPHYRQHYLWHSRGRHAYARGSKVGPGDLVRASDAAARVRAGLPSSGRVKSGTIARGGIGQGSSHTSSSGG